MEKPNRQEEIKLLAREMYSWQPSPDPPPASPRNEKYGWEAAKVMAPQLCWQKQHNLPSGLPVLKSSTQPQY